MHLIIGTTLVTEKLWKGICNKSLMMIPGIPSLLCFDDSSKPKAGNRYMAMVYHEPHSYVS